VIRPRALREFAQDRKLVKPDSGQKILLDAAPMH